MSKVGKRAIVIPEGTEVTIEPHPDGQAISIGGPKGSLSYKLGVEFEALRENDKLRVVPKRTELSKELKAAWGLHRAKLGNIIRGVSTGFEKKLELEGIGYRASIQGGRLILNLGFSHPIELKIPDGIKASVEKNVITVAGADKYLVGQFAADIKAQKPPEPYKGKGVRYQGEVIKRKAGKKAVAAGG